MSKQEFRDAKVAYKQARKAAGKSRKPLVIAIIIVLLIVAGGAAAATWYFMDQQMSSQQAEKTAAEEATQEQPAEPNDSVVESESESPYAKFVGEWEGSLTSTVAGIGLGKRCYGAEDEPMQLDIQSISESGRVKASAEFLFHGHEYNSDSSDADTMTGDAMVEVKDLTSTFDRNGFEFTASVPKSNGKVIIRVVPKSGTTSDELEVTVTSEFDDRQAEKDTYLLTRVD